jgi:quercetin dioxygenase-like cupin family protein
MRINIGSGQAMRRSLPMAAVIVGAMFIAATAATAGECPVDKMGVDVTKPSTMAAKDVTDKVLASIDLAKEPAQLQDRQLRLRKLEIKPGGIVPWHSHGDRPAIIYIIQGTVTEYASNCAVPIVHKAGDVARETSKTSHWWKNTGKTTVILLSADILHTGADEHMM